MSLKEGTCKESVGAVEGYACYSRVHRLRISRWKQAMVASSNGIWCMCFRAVDSFPRISVSCRQ